jgi:hypothetical protein
MQISTDPLSFCKQATALLQQADESYDCEYDLRELLPHLYAIHDYPTQGDRPIGVYPCGSERLLTTPASLYRALYLFKPKRVDFSSMYKTTLFSLVSPDYQLLVDVDLWKYELALYFNASREHIDGTKQPPVTSGLPGHDNGIHFIGERPTLWFGLLGKLLTREWSVYNGNDFCV